MLKRYRNAIFAAVQKSGLPTDDFEIEDLDDGDGYPEFRLTYSPANLRFILTTSDDDPDHFLVRFSRFSGAGVDDPAEVDLGQHAEFQAFENAIQYFEAWLERDVRRSIEEDDLPDLWTETRAAAAASLAPQSTDDEPFSEEQQHQMKFAVRSFKLLVFERFQPMGEQKEIVAEQIEYLTDAVERLSRRDWKGVAISTVIGIATTLSLDSAQGRALWGLFQQAVSTVFHLLK